MCLTLEDFARCTRKAVDCDGVVDHEPQGLKEYGRKIVLFPDPQGHVVEPLEAIGSRKFFGPGQARLCSSLQVSGNARLACIDRGESPPSPSLVAGSKDIAEHVCKCLHDISTVGFNLESEQPRHEGVDQRDQHEGASARLGRRETSLP